ncbi:hypothetical protein [Parashewanella tropica]|uniref:hypothetical protein n=1 Tax=Parashewanella tropica TaxID=2547970 RepID=UPI00105AA59C|nr:hypothetical protein [Parashewanella tropica]
MFKSPQFQTKPDLSGVFAMYDLPNERPNAERRAEVTVKGLVFDECFRVTILDQGRLSIKSQSVKCFVEFDVEGQQVDANSKADASSESFKLYSVIITDPRFPDQKRAIELLNMPISKAMQFIIQLPEDLLIQTFIEMFKLAGLIDPKSGKLLAEKELPVDMEKDEIIKALDKIEEECLCYRTVKEKLNREADAKAAYETSLLEEEKLENDKAHVELSAELRESLTHRQQQIEEEHQKAKSNVAYLWELSVMEHTKERLDKYRVTQNLTEEDATQILHQVQQEIASQWKGLSEQSTKLPIKPKGIEFRGRLFVELLWRQDIEKYQTMLNLMLRYSEYRSYIPLFCDAIYMNESLAECLVSSNIGIEAIAGLLTRLSNSEQLRLIKNFALTDKGILLIADLVNYFASLSATSTMTDDSIALISVIGGWIHIAQQSQYAELRDDVSLEASDKQSDPTIHLTTVQLKERFKIKEKLPSQEDTVSTIEEDFEWVISTADQKVLNQISEEGKVFLKPYLKRENPH